MWAIRKASIRIKLQPFSSVAFRACYAKLETASNTVVAEPSPHTSERSLFIKRFSSRAHGAQSSSLWKHSFSSQAGTKSSGEEDDDLKYDFSELDVDATSGVTQGKNVEHESNDELLSETDVSESEDEVDDIAVEEPQIESELSDTEKETAKSNGRGKRASSGLFKALVGSTSVNAKKHLDKWVEEGNELSRIEKSRTMLELRRRRMYGRALQFSEWLESQETVEFGERDYASRVDLIAKVRGLQQAESYIDKIPESFKGEVVYRTLLANCVLSTQTARAEKIFNKMKALKLPVTAFACNQLLLLYKRTDKRKIADVLLLMEKEDIKPSLFTYRLLIDTKGQSNDISGMEQILETMKSEGLEPDLRLQAVLARQYVHGGLKEKAKTVLKEMEGDNLNENRMACSSLLHIYGLLGSVDDVKRVWEVCKPDPRLEECMSAIDAFGKLKKVEEAEAVFDQMSKRWKTLSAKHYTSMLRVYANNKMLSKGQDLVRQMGESGCRIGPFTLDAIVKLYIESGEIEKADSILKKGSQQIQTKPLFSTYMMVLDQYSKRGDVHNSERMFHRMRLDGYVSRFRQYNSLLQAYINAKVPAYGFRERMKADNVFPSKSLAAQLVQVDAFKKTAMSDLLD